MNTIEKMEASGEAARIRGKLGTVRGNRLIGAIAGAKDRCHYPFYENYN